MKVLVNRAALVEALALATGVVLTRTPKPVLTCVKLSTGESAGVKTLTVTATDLEIALQYQLTQVDIGAPGVALIPAAKIAEIVNNSPDDTLQLDTEGDSTDIKGSDAQYKILGYNVEEFPPIGEFEGKADFSLPAGTLRKLLDRSKFAAAREMTRYAINGVLFEKKDNRLLLVATDGHRLALSSAELPAGGRDVTAVVPIKVISLLERLLSDPEHIVSLHFSETRLTASVAADENAVPHARMSSPLVEGSFPPYQDVVPKDSDKKVTLPREAFASGVRRAALLTNEESKGIRLAFAAGALTISSRAAEMGEASVKMPIDYTGEALEIGFNPVYLLDALKAADTDEVTLELKTSAKPGLLKAGPGFSYVVMPVTLT